MKIRSVEFREPVPGYDGTLSSRYAAPDGCNSIQVCDVGVVIPGRRHPDRDGGSVVLVPWANVRWVVCEGSE